MGEEVEETPSGLPPHLDAVLRNPRSPRKATFQTSFEEQDEGTEAERIRKGLSSLISQGEDGISVNIPFRGSQPTLSYRSRECYPEAAEYMCQNLLQSGVPLWYGLLLARRMGLEMYPPLPPSSDDDASPPPPSSSPVRNNIAKRADALLATFVEELLQQSDAALLRDRPDSIRPYSVYAAKNQRRKMEDRHVLIPSLWLSFPDCSRHDEYYAVFDGHGGAEVAGYLATHLHHHLVAAPSFQTDVKAAFLEAFESCDSALIGRAKKTNYRGGSTAVAALIRGPQLTVAWAGDSQAALIRLRSEPLLFTQPLHSPQEPSEFARVEAADGSIVSIEGELRVMGCLNLTRSFGDVALKPDIVIARPDLVQHDLDPEQDLALLLGCDGFFDHVSLDRLLPLLKDFAAEHSPSNFSALSKVLAEEAKSGGSSDNITVLLCLLCEPEQLWKKLSAA